MGFEDLLRKKLGPMRDLVSRKVRPPPPVYDPARLFYRRAVGLEIRVRPEDSWSEVEIGRVDQPERTRVRIDLEDAAFICGLTRWQSAEEIGRIHRRKPAELWSWVERDLLFYAVEDPKDPNAELTGENGVIARLAERRIARRPSMWPTAAVETRFEIAPMPFMPRAADLEGAHLAGMRFAGLERGHEVLGVTITGGPRTGRILRRLLPRLDGRRTQKEVLDAFSKEERLEADKLLDLLDRLTVLEAAAGPPDPAPLFAAGSGPDITWLGHAAVLIRAAQKSILVDPLFFSISQPEPKYTDPPKFDPRALPPIDAVFITHGDNDHLNANTLVQIPESTPVYIPRLGDRPAPYQVDMRAMLRVLGFERVIELETWAGVAIGDLTVTACPFEGESWGLPLAKHTYLVESPEMAVFLAADSAPMDEVYRTIAGKRSRPVDLALMGVSGCAETFVMPDGFGYGNFYREWVPRVRHNEWIQHCAGPTEAAKSLAILRPRFAFGYAAGGARWIKTEYSDTGDHEAMASKVAELGLSTKPVALPLGRPVALAALEDLG